jgi:lipoate-protein ligase A
MSQWTPIFDQLHIILDGAHCGALNMAVDQALLETAATPVLRVYDWDQPTVSIGYGNEFKERDDGLPVVRRWTGGGTVRHGGDATYAIIVPLDHAWGRTRPAESYRVLHHALAVCLNQFGLGPCELATESDRKDGAFCFEAPATFDVMRGGRKIAGAGQRRGRMGVLHQGSVSLPLTREFWAAFGQLIACEITINDGLSDTILQRAQELVRVRYAAESWLHDKRDEASTSS